MVVLKATKKSLNFLTTYPILHFIQSYRIIWYGHVMRRDEQYVGKREMGMNIQGRRGRGRPKRRWMDCVRDDLRSKGLMGVGQEQMENTGQKH